MYVFYTIYGQHSPIFGCPRKLVYMGNLRELTIYDYMPSQGEEYKMIPKRHCAKGVFTRISIEPKSNYVILIE